MADTTNAPIASKKRVSRPKEERIADINRRIEKHKQDIASLESKKEAILNPKKRTQRKIPKRVYDNGYLLGLSKEEIEKMYYEAQNKN